jgi:hypothetical protein
LNRISKGLLGHWGSSEAPFEGTLLGRRMMTASHNSRLVTLACCGGAVLLLARALSTRKGADKFGGHHQGAEPAASLPPELLCPTEPPAPVPHPLEECSILWRGFFIVSRLTKLAVVFTPYGELNFFTILKRPLYSDCALAPVLRVLTFEKFFQPQPRVCFLWCPMIASKNTTSHFW